MVHVLEIDPQNAMANLYLGFAFAPLGRHKEAIQVFQKAQATGGMPWCDESIGWVYGLMREGRKARGVLQSSLAKIKNQMHVPSSAIALIHAGLGDNESALAILKRCIEERDPLIPWIKYTPGLNQLAQDPRMRDILRRIGLQ